MKSHTADGKHVLILVNNLDLWLHFINYLKKGDQYVITDANSKAENELIKEGTFFFY